MAHFDRGVVTRCLADNFGNGLSSFFPLRVKSSALQHSLFEEDRKKSERPNLTPDAHDYLAACQGSAEELFYHVAAILRSPAYADENSTALRQDWPRIPLPGSGASLSASSELGKAVGALMDPDKPLKGVTSGAIRPELKLIGVARGDKGGLDLSVTAGWGHGGRGQATMPGTGRTVERALRPAETAAIGSGAAALGVPAKQLKRLLGDSTLDIYLNESTCWSNIPARVWGYTLGGYAVLKKWLSYREEAVLGRPLTHTMRSARSWRSRRIAALLLLEPALDANYRAVAASPSPWGG